MHTILLAAALPALVAAHRDAFGHHHARQATALAPATAATTPVPSVTLLSVNPTAVPLASIHPGTLSDLTTAAFATQTMGAVPTYMPSGAPGLPDITNVVVANYPKADTPPPTNSTQVQQWIAEVKASGVQIPGYDTTSASDGCAGNNAAAAADPTRCWWTCGGCTRDTDITVCPKPGQWGLTYDDGPSTYTPNLMEFLAQNNLKATIFAVGSRVLYNPRLLQQQYMAGHQIAVHTWAHPHLTNLTNEEVIAELGWGRQIIKDVLGVTPNFMRPPYGDMDDRVRNISIAMGMWPVMWTRINATMTFDTSDYDVAGGLSTPEQVMQNWNNIMANVSSRTNGFIVLEHDLFEQAVELATGYILPDALQRSSPKLDIMPVSECMGLPLSDAYVETNNNATHPPAQSVISGGVSAANSSTAGNATTAGSSAAKASGTKSAAGRTAGLGVGTYLMTATTFGMLVGAGALFL